MPTIINDLETLSMCLRLLIFPWLNKGLRIIYDSRHQTMAARLPRYSKILLQKEWGSNLFNDHCETSLRSSSHSFCSIFSRVFRPSIIIEGKSRQRVWFTTKQCQGNRSINKLMEFLKEFQSFCHSSRDEIYEGM